MKNNQKQNKMQSKMTEKEALKFLAQSKPRAKAKSGRSGAKKNAKIKDDAENLMVPDDVLITNIGGKRVVLDEAKRKEIDEFVLALGEEEEAKEAFTTETRRTQRKNTGITIIFVYDRCTYKKAAQL